MRLSLALKAAIYATFAALLVTGAVWLLMGEETPRPAMRADLIKLHGLGAMVSLVILGQLLAEHVPAGLRAQKRRTTGLLTIGLYAFLAFTGYLLYYAGGERLRSFSSIAHVVAGFAVVPLLLGHCLPFATRREAQDSHSQESSP